MIMMLFYTKNSDIDLLSPSSSFFVDIHTKERYYKSDLNIMMVTNEYVKDILKFESKHCLDWLIWAYNNDLIAIKHRWQKQRSIKWTRVRSWWEYWIDWLSTSQYKLFFSRWIRIYGYTLFKPIDMYGLIEIAKEKWIVERTNWCKKVQKKQLKKAVKRRTGTWKLRDDYRNTLLYCSKVSSILSNVNATEDDMKFIINMQNKFDIWNMVLINDDMQKKNLREAFLSWKHTISSFINKYK